MKIQNKYISISKKKELANKVIMMSSDHMEGLVKIDSFKQRVYTFMLAAEVYLGENFGDDFDVLMDKYDEIMQSDLAEQIENLDDYIEFKLIVKELVADTKDANSIEYSVSKMCQAVVNAVGNISDALADKISEFDTDILNDTNVMELMSVVNRLK